MIKWTEEMYKDMFSTASLELGTCENYNSTGSKEIIFHENMAKKLSAKNKIKVTANKVKMQFFESTGAPICCPLPNQIIRTYWALKSGWLTSKGLRKQRLYFKKRGMLNETGNVITITRKVAKEKKK